MYNHTEAHTAAGHWPTLSIWYTLDLINSEIEDMFRGAHSSSESSLFLATISSACRSVARPNSLLKQTFFGI